MKKIIFFLILSLLFLASAQALCTEPECEVNHSLPTITMHYSMDVNILEATMTWLETTDNIEFTLAESSPNVFEFTPNQYLVNGDYKLIVTAENNEGLTGTEVYYFLVQAPAMQINIESPKQWTGEGLNYAVGNSQIFNITVITDEPAECLYTTTSSADPNINFSSSTGTTHIIENFDSDPKTLNENPEGSWKTLKIKCLSSELQQMTVKNFYISYLSDSYSLEPTFNINPMIDYSQMHSTLTVPVSDQKLFCELTHEPLPDEINQGDFSLETTNYESSEWEDYILEPQQYFDYSDATIEEEGSIPFNLTCWNLAGLEQETNINLNYEFEDTFDIIKISPEEYVSTGSFDVIVETEVHASCTVDYLGETLEMTTEDNITHANEEFTGMSEGRHEFSVSCEGLALDENNMKLYADSQINFHTIVDLSNPTTPEVIAQNNSCSLTSLQASFTAEDPQSGIDYYNYSIWHSGSKLVNWTISDNNAAVTLELVDGDSYTWKVKAVNNAGRESADAGEKTVKATAEDDPACDNTNPQVNYELIEGETSITVNISCTDSGSGCTGAFTYSLISLDEICDYTTGNNKNYGDLITVYEDSLFCVRVTDMAGNEDTDNFAVIVPVITNPYACQTSDDCAPGSYCEEGICYPDIITGDECTVDTSDVDCETEEICMNGFCQTPSSCTGDLDCAGNYCVDSTCTAPHQDTDNDGIPDWWEWEHFNCVDCVVANEDPDSDDYNNYQEYNAGTDPNNPLSYPLTDQPVSKNKTVSIILFVLALIFMLSGALLYNYHPAKEETQLVQKSKPKLKQKKTRTSKQAATAAKLRKKVSRKSLFSEFGDEENEEKKKPVMEEFEPKDIKKKGFDKTKYKKALKGMIDEKKINKIEAGNMVLELFNSKKLTQEETKELMKELDLI